MARANIPQSVRQLIARHIDSVQQVEILELLRREPEREWTAEQISRTLRIAPVSCAEWLERFTAAGMVEHAPVGYRHKHEGRQVEAVGELVECYSRRRTSVIEAIYSKPSTSIQSFSDAFRLRRED